MACDEAICSVERYGPQAPGEYWWAGLDAAGDHVVSFWTEDRNPQDLIDLARKALAEEA